MFRQLRTVARLLQFIHVPASASLKAFRSGFHIVVFHKTSPSIVLIIGHVYFPVFKLRADRFGNIESIDAKSTEFFTELLIIQLSFRSIKELFDGSRRKLILRHALVDKFSGKLSLLISTFLAELD